MLAMLKPTMAKVLLAAALFGLTYWAQSAWWNAHIADYWAYGFPFQFQERWGPCPPGEICRAFKALPLVADVVIWYAVSVVVLSAVKAVWDKGDGQAARRKF